ncbi:MAG TPA: orotidine-5'-phosphate decarboxylase [Campylobacterales bacterium]|nr:orotidine-5'-phosphate decarboxylase [Campylobacterales bacterium]
MELCLALDRPTLSDNLELVRELKEFNIWLKIGFRSYVRDGNRIIEELKNINPNFKIFLDLKLYDIPNTMADTSEEIADLGVDMFNIHASAGKSAMVAVMERLKNREKRPIVLAVTALTSFGNSEFLEIYNKPIPKWGIEFAKASFEAGLDGVVSSVFESKAIKEATSSDFLTVTPGIRPFGESNDDQKRVGNIFVAKNQHVDIIVVGRPIYNAEEPKEVVEKILVELEK